MYQIESNVKQPKRHPARRSKYPFGHLRVGQSFYVEAGDISDSQSIRLAAWRAGKRFDPERKFSVRLVEGGVRVWRVE